jgi:hypothetical protein
MSEGSTPPSMTGEEERHTIQNGLTADAGCKAAFSGYIEFDFADFAPMKPPSIFISGAGGTLLKINHDGTIECDGIDQATEAAQVFIKSIREGWKLATSADVERSAIVAWLRKFANQHLPGERAFTDVVLHNAATCISRGDHIPTGEER